MVPLRTLGVYLLALGLFLALAAPALAGDSTYGTLDTGASKDAVILLPAAPGPAGVAPAGSAPASAGPAPGRAGGLNPALAAAALSGLGLLLMAGGLVLRGRRS